MPGPNILILVASMVLACSCCTEHDSRVPHGYPYGNYQELNIRRNFPLKTPQNIHNQLIAAKISGSGEHIRYFDNKDTCEKILKSFDSSCNCEGIDFNSHVLILAYGSISRMTNGVPEPRAVVNHRAKEYCFEIRGYAKDCRKYEQFNINEWCLIPRPPHGYRFRYQKFFPVE